MIDFLPFFSINFWFQVLWYQSFWRSMTPSLSCRMNINFSFRWSIGLKSHPVKRYPKGIKTGLLRKWSSQTSPQWMAHLELETCEFSSVCVFCVWICLNINHIIWLIGMILPKAWLLFLCLGDLWTFLDVFGLYEIFHTRSAQPPNWESRLNLWLLYRWFHNCTS